MRVLCAAVLLSHLAIAADLSAAVDARLVMSYLSHLSHLDERARLLAIMYHHRKTSLNYASRAARRDEGEAEEEQARRNSNKRQREAAAVAAVMDTPISVVDSRSAEELEEDMRRRTVYRVTLQKLEPLLPGIGRGNSAANDTASRQRRPLRFPNEQGGIFDAHSSSQIRYKTGMEKEEFAAFYESTFLDAEGNRLPRSWLFAEPRNNLGRYSGEENKTRRAIRGSMNDRDRVLCWLEMLRRDTLFEDMALAYGRCAGTYHNEFKDMTAAAQNMPSLQEEIQWPDAEERAVHCNFIQYWGHPEFPRIAYIADGTMVNIRNPAKVGKGQPEPHGPVHAENYSGNKGLGISHIVYCNIRGKIIRIETVPGAMNDRGAHLASRVYTHPEEFLSDNEVGMGDGAYAGVARSDSNDLYMCVPYKKPAHGDLTGDERRFNTEQRRYRVVVENTIGQIKKWKVVGNGKAFRHRRDFEADVFNVCARLTARIMRVRDRYPRSSQWIGRVRETWETKLGIHYYWDYEDPRSYLVHNEGENYVYGVVTQTTGTELQLAWNAVWALEI